METKKTVTLQLNDFYKKHIIMDTINLAEQKLKLFSKNQVYWKMEKILGPKVN